MSLIITAMDNKNKMTKAQAQEHARKYGWENWLGYSKRELGIKTPKRPKKKNAQGFQNSLPTG